MEEGWYPKGSVIAWIFFIFSEAAVLGTKERQLGGPKAGGGGEERSWAPEDFLEEMVSIPMQDSREGAFPSLKDIPTNVAWKTSGPGDPHGSHL